MIKLSILLLFIPFWTSTGNIYPGTGENIDRGGLTDWTNPTRITSDDGLSTTNNGTGSNYLVARTFGFAIPTGAAINGVFVRVEAAESSGGTEPLLAQLQDETGALFGSSKSTSNEGNLNGTSLAFYTYGSTSDVWGATLTEAIVEDVDFGVRLWYATAHVVSIEEVTMAIEYTTVSGRRVFIISKR